MGTANPFEHKLERWLMLRLQDEVRKGLDLTTLSPEQLREQVFQIPSWQQRLEERCGRRRGRRVATTLQTTLEGCWKEIKARVS
jgi:hypothetical protein